MSIFVVLHQDVHKNENVKANDVKNAMLGGVLVQALVIEAHGRGLSL